MGDFSQDPNVRLQASVDSHYVGVRLQQGVPFLDSDWNELEDLRKHELSEFIRSFIGSGVPSDNDGFRIEALAAGGIGNLILQVDTATIGISSIEVDLGMSTGADRLGFLPGNIFSERDGSSPAILSGNVTEPFVLADGLTFTIRVSGDAAQTVTFNAADFADIAQATAAEVIAVFDANFTGITTIAGDGQNFIIHGGGGTVATAGRILAEGVEALNENSLMYTSQPLYLNNDLAVRWNVDPVAAIDAVASDRQDIVYLDVWEREVDVDEDETIVQTAIGVETATRLRREWAVRIVSAPLADPQPAIPKVAGHKYIELAKLVRDATTQAVLSDSIIDLRKLNLNVAKYLKTPIYITNGTDTVTAEDFANMMQDLKSILTTRYQRRIFNFTYEDDYNEQVVRLALEDIMQHAALTAVQARTGNLNNEDALQVLDVLYDLQTEFVRVIDEYGDFDGDAETQTFMDEYSTYLGNLPVGSTTGLKPAVDNQNLISAVSSQEDINVWLSIPTDVLPEGSVLLAIDAVNPQTNVTYNVPFNITYEIESLLSSTQAQETFEISVETASPSAWELNLLQNQITVDSAGGSGTFDLTVIPRSGTTSAEFLVTVTSVRNPTVTYTHSSGVFTEGLPPLEEEFFVWVTPSLDSEGRAPFSQANFTAGNGEVQFQLNIINTSDSDTHRFSVSHHVVAPAGEEADWAPDESVDTSTEITISAGEMQATNRSIFGPNTPDVGTEGTVIAEATLIEINGVAPTVDEEKSHQIELTFIVT